MWFETNLLLLAAALLVEAAFGYPKSLTRRMGHPVMWIGALIDRIERRWNRPTLPDPQRRLNGVWCVAAMLIVSAGAAAILQGMAVRLLPWLVAVLCLAVLASSLFAQRSLHDHVAAVREGLAFGGVPEGRKQVARIVGRDPAALDEAGVARAAIESLAENFSDGVTAPAIWCALFGLPGAAAYKAINTADSMIGHRNERYGQFGRAAARLDDLVNLPASRLSVGWIVLAAAIMPGASPAGALRAVWRDARRHHSPNAGWPEAAMAGALGLRIGGPRQYAESFVDDPWMGDGRPAATPDDIGRALRLYRRAAAIQIVAILALLLAIAL